LVSSRRENGFVAAASGVAALCQVYVAATTQHKKAAAEYRLPLKAFGSPGKNPAFLFWTKLLFLLAGAAVRTNDLQYPRQHTTVDNSARSG
jgi:hypothetical protein